MERLETILGNLGLDRAMAEVFAYLANKKKATMEEMYEDTSLSRKAISLALEALESEGAVKRDGPAFTVEDVREALMALLPARFEELKAEVYSYRPAPMKKECPGVEAVRDDASVVPSFTAKNIDAALTSVDMISRSLAWLDDVSLNAARASIQRGVKVRVITFKHPGLEADARALADAGVEVRSHEYSNDVRFMMVDGEFIAFALKEPPGVEEPAYFGLLIRDRGVCKKVLDHIFEPAWGEAKVVEEYRI
jgi:sugar-specific transcriptional regulator TrmB